MNTLYRKLCLLVLLMFMYGINAWAQPQSITVLDDETIGCEGKVRLKFEAGFDESSDDYITNAQLYLNDGDSGGERELLYITNFGNADTEIDMGFEDWEWSRRSTGASNIGYIESVGQKREGDRYFFIVTIKNLTRRSENALNFRLRWSWDGDTDYSNEDTDKQISKKTPINVAIVTAFRDDCNPNEVKVTSSASIACNKSGFKYRVTIQKSLSSDFSSPTTLVDKRVYESENEGDAVDTQITDNTLGQIYFKSIIEYVDNNGLIFQTEESAITPVQAFSVAPPTLTEVSEEVCDNTIDVKWAYNAAAANSFKVYRSSNKINTLNFDGDNDCLTIAGGGNMFTNSSITLEARVKLSDLQSNNIFNNPGNFDVYTNSNGNLVTSVGGVSLTSDDPLPLNTWVHIAIVYDYTSSLKVYLNGNLVGQAAASSVISSNSNIVYFGCYSGGYHFNGELADIRIWNKALVNIDPNLTVTGAESDLLLYYDFSEGVPQGDNTGLSTIQNRSSSNYNAQLDNFTLQGQSSNFNTTFSNYQEVGQVNGTSFEYTDNQNIESNQAYSYYITAIKTCSGNTNESLPSNNLTGLSPTTPLTPTGLNIVSNIDENTIVLNWTDNAFDETAYEIHRRYGDASNIFTIQSNDTTYIDNEVLPCRIYEYDVYAKNVCGLSSESAQASTVLEPDLSIALSKNQFNASKGVFMNRVELMWTPQAGVDLNNFRVYRKLLGTTDSVQVDVVNGNIHSYRDETADAGVLYEYTLIGEKVCAANVIRTNAVSTIGFRSATALVSGQVTYTGGNTVEGVKVLVAPADGTQVGRSLNLDGIDDKVVMDSINWTNQSFTFEFWAKRGDTDASTIIAHGSNTTIDNQNLNIGFNATGNFVFGFGNNDLITTQTYNNADWQHWTCVYDASTNTRYIYNNDSLVISDIPTAPYAGDGRQQIGTTLQNTDFFTGQLDETRIWSIARDSASVVQDYNRILNANELGIFASYSFDEGIGYGVYDRSKTGITFNEQHGVIMGTTDLNAAWSNLIPTPDQLGLYALTDANGNYIISSIPYIGVGQTFKVVPQLGTHQFEPSQRNLFVGERSDIFNGTDFSDISSFPVTGTVFYKGTTCPADQIEIQIDGVTAVVNGNKVTTNTNGAFIVDVPIGQHKISLFKEGHEFEVGQFPTDGSFYNFQEPVSGIEFIDSTKLNVIGRVVGGIREGDKVPGLNRSVNNIGKARVIYEALVGNGCHRDTVFTDSQTGEYVTQLYPLKYIVTDVRVINPLQNISTSDFFDALPQINLVNIAGELTARDSVFAAGTTTLERVDSVKYNYRQDFIYRKTAEIEVLDQDGQEAFLGVKEHGIISTTSDGENVTFKETLDNILYPVFESYRPYTALIKAFEEYTNEDMNAPIETDRVAVTDGEFIVNNEIAFEGTQNLTFQTDTAGQALYMFKANAPSLEQNTNFPAYSFTRTMDITLRRVGQVEDVKWYPNPGTTIQERIYRAYITGQKAVDGASFASQGPDEVKFVLRDPPGSASVSTFTKNAEWTEGWTNHFGGGAEFEGEKQISSGLQLTIGLGTSQDVKAKTDFSFGFSAETSYQYSDISESTYSTSTSYSTPDGVEAIESDGDVYVGTTKPIVFGMAKKLMLVDTSFCNNSNVDCLEASTNGRRKIAIVSSFYVDEKNDEKSLFAFTQNYIENYLIPRLQTLRNNFFNTPLYTSHLSSGDDNYGINNDDPRLQGTALDYSNNIFKSSYQKDSTITVNGVSKDTTITISNFLTTAGDATGLSYTYNGDMNTYGIGTDSVRWYNQAIRRWEETIAKNEEDKITAINSSRLKRVIQFDGQVSITRTDNNSYYEEAANTFEVGLSQTIKNEFEVAAGANGANFENSLSINQKYSFEETSSSVSETEWEYSIADGDQGDDLQIEVYESKFNWGPIFRKIAGQTGCPHEIAQVSKYYQPGTNMSNTTLQRDKIGVAISPSIVQNVPEGEGATFTIILSNLSETNDVREYAVQIDPTSNPSGLNCTMDGESLLGPVSITLGEGESLQKTIVCERGPEEYDYQGIRLLAFVPCQFQYGASDEIDLVDTVTFDVSFLPECTDIRLKEPTDLWVVNTFNQDTLPITIDNYDINKNGFESVSLQYRPASEATWRELNKWWHPINRANEMGDQIPTNSSFIRYDWDMSSNVDGPYHMRVVSTCELANKETEFKQGTADRINPTTFGTPSPSDGICDPGEDLRIKFNEPIDIGSLTSLNFDIRGVLNGTDIRHSESIAFDGSNDYMDITAYDLTKRSFSVEFWAKPNNNSAGTIFSQGSDAANALTVGFDASGRFHLNLAGQTITANIATPANEWKHFVASFDYASSTAKLFIDGVEDIVSNGFTTSYTGIGGLRLGQDISGTGTAFNGNLHELRLWSTSRSTIDIVPNMNLTLSPTTAGLIGYWQMNEGIGTIAKDKVRSRNAVLSGATWEILPVGYAYNLDGSDDYLEVTNAGLLTMSDESDITIEAWFKAAAAGTILSNGKGDGTDTETSWTVGVNGAGKVVMNNNGNTFEGTTTGLLDDNWHHLAIVIERNSAIKLYVDGALSTTAPTNGYAGFAGSKLWIGTRGWFNGAVEMRDQYFSGRLDEIRIWNTARRVEQVERDWVNRLSGDELGLLAYYPFETYVLDAGVPVLNQSIMDESENMYDLSVYGSASPNLEQITPSIKLQRPIEKVNFTYTVNQDEIILTPTDPSARLEHVTLDITVRDVKDRYGNVLQSPATWIAFVNKNQVVWDRDEIEQEVNTGEETTFEVSIVNTGGSAERYDLLNLPAWLTASPSSGIIAPNSSLNVSFTIADGVNIGFYEQDIYLSTDFGFNERLTLKLKVAATAPEWIFDNSQYQHSMSYVGELKINGVISTDTEDQISVFVEEELRGIANVELDPITNKYLVFLDVYSNEVTGDELEFRIWDASEGQIKLPVDPTDHVFLLHEFVGTPSNPQIFEAQGSIAQAYSLDAGWNWISFPLASSMLVDVNETLDGLNAANNDRILSQDAFDTFLDSDGWIGSLSGTGGFNRKEGYKIYLTNPGTFSYSGTLGDPSSEPIVLSTGWDWIGMISLDQIEINAALASLTPTDGDVIKGQRTFAVYQQGLGWAGSLDFLEPTEGYMIKLANGGTLAYPNVSNLPGPSDALVKSAERLKLLEAQMDLNVKAFEKTMSLVATFKDCNHQPIGKDAYLAAYVNEECRGIYPVEWINKAPIAYLTLHANAGEQFTFKLITEGKQITYVLNETLEFKADILRGTMIEPILMTALENCDKLDISTTAQANYLNEVSIYPNPFSKQLTIEVDVEIEEEVHVTLQDVTGRTVATIFDGRLDSGNNKLVWKEETKQPLSSGIYFINIQSSTMIHIEKVIR